MAFSHGRTAEIYAKDSGGTERNLTAYLKDGSFDQSADIPDTTVLSNTAKAYIAGIKDREIKCGGLYDPTVEGYLVGMLNTATQVKYFPAGSASGRTYYDGTVLWDSFNIKSDITDANAIEFGGKFIANPTFGTA